MRSSLVSDRGVWLRFGMARSSWHTAAWDFFARLHIDPLSLVIPIGSLVDGLHFRKDERVAAEAVWAFPLHVGRKNHFVSATTCRQRAPRDAGRPVCSPRAQGLRSPAGCNRVAPASRRVPGCLPSMPPDDRFEPRR